MVKGNDINYGGCRKYEYIRFFRENMVKRQSFGNRVSGYGLKVTKRDRDLYFSQSIKTVTLLVPFRDGPRSVEVNVDKKSFWNGCRELIFRDIGQWLIENGLETWPPGKPHRIRRYASRSMSSS